MFGASTDPLHALVVDHGRKAIASADLIVFVVDGREGLVSGDEEIAGALRSAGAPVIVAVNKTDDRRARGRAVEFYRLGFEPVVEMAAEHGTGVGDLLDEILQRLPTGRRDGPAGVAGARNRGRDHRPAQRRQVVAVEPVAARGALDRQRDAGHDPRYGGRAACAGTAGRSGSSIRPASAGRAGWRARVRSKPSA